MPVAIDATSNVATITESTTFFGKALDGFMGALPVVGSDDYFTRGETQGAELICLVASAALSSNITRKRVAKNLKPTWGFFF
jgi:hypothetical protein